MSVRMSTCLCLLWFRERTEQRSSDFSTILLAGVAALNIQRLVYRPSYIAWDAITLHLLFIFYHPAALPSIRLQAAGALDGILAITHHHLAAGPGDLQATMYSSVAHGTVWHSRSCRVDSHRARGWNFAAWALRRCTRFSRH